MSEHKNNGRKLNASLKYVFLSALAVVFLLAGCEPNDWDLILSVPEPVENLTVTHPVLGPQDIQFDFTLPDLAVAEIYPSYETAVCFYYREAAGTDEIYIGWEGYYEKSQLGAPQTVLKDLTSEGLSGGTDYVFILYTVDGEHQKSIGVVSAVVTW